MASSKGLGSGQALGLASLPRCLCPSAGRGCAGSLLLLLLPSNPRNTTDGRTHAAATCCLVSLSLAGPPQVPRAVARLTGVLLLLLSGCSSPLRPGWVSQKPGYLCPRIQPRFGEKAPGKPLARCSGALRSSE